MTSTVTKTDKVSFFVTRLYKGSQKPLNYSIRNPLGEKTQMEQSPYFQLRSEF